MFVKGISGEEGEVVAVHGDSATVKIKANDSCEKCRLCKRLSSTEMVVEALVERPVRKGERVIVAVRPGIVFKSALILYLFPLIGMVCGYYAGKTILQLFHISAKGELFPVVFSFLFLFLSFVPIRIYDRKKQNDRRFRVYITDRTPA
jgi:positive regulator of sigma E activity